MYAHFGGLKQHLHLYTGISLVLEGQRLIVSGTFVRVSFKGKSDMILNKIGFPTGFAQGFGPSWLNQVLFVLVFFDFCSDCSVVNHGNHEERLICSQVDNEDGPKLIVGFGGPNCRPVLKCKN
eukprot:CAMPEP_0198143994 /NCGR_PEP_ID=MMETSP1443-20131203/12350_1 /TAXON_ID=186043 /ORGANISM="Entomoneis sp., Strain CCMP2396" /LENGTH=122 /DNA_ID=CAMNT_0043807311 /DNA_START=352 /DNA_END=721 /DNA_ORIENTATION=-